MPTLLSTLRRSDRHRLLAWPLVLLVFLSAMPAPLWAEEDESTKDKVMGFFDKWIINGGNLGGAIGAVMGQFLMGAICPGPVGLVVGSLLGNQIGQLIGEYMDNKVYRAYNYAAFNRPALGEPGSVVLEGAGRWEQSFYQVDRWIISGGGLATMAAHFFFNFAARTVPGAGFFAMPLFLILGDYVAGNIGDNVDGLIDLSLLGRKIDKMKGNTLEVDTHAPSAPGDARPTIAESTLLVHDCDQAYRELQAAMASGDQAAIQSAYGRYQALKVRRDALK